jgi:peptidoglycan/xylan/chitin deacetylase (PgdA/CDA1 family)
VLVEGKYELVASGWQLALRGHAIGSHTWCHQDLSKTKGRCNVKGKIETVEYDPKDEIEKGVSAVRWAVGGSTAPYFRFPALRQPQELPCPTQRAFL